MRKGLRPSCASTCIMLYKGGGFLKLLLATLLASLVRFAVDELIFQRLINFEAVHETCLRVDFVAEAPA